MQASLPHSVLSASLAVMASIVTATPASAMGRSPTPSVRASESVSRIEVVEKRADQALQAQVEALRQEVADLKSRVERQDVAAAE